MGPKADDVPEVELIGPEARDDVSRSETPVTTGRSSPGGFAGAALLLAVGLLVAVGLVLSRSDGTPPDLDGDRPEAQPSEPSTTPAPVVPVDGRSCGSKPTRRSSPD